VACVGNIFGQIEQRFNLTNISVRALVAFVNDYFYLTTIRSSTLSQSIPFDLFSKGPKQFSSSSWMVTKKIPEENSSNSNSPFGPLNCRIVIFEGDFFAMI
jgi:hypothetical protein